MQAAVTTADGGFAIETLPDIEPGPGDVVVRVAACGICGSDLTAHRVMPHGTVMGHEIYGEVVATGREAGTWRIGSAVAVLPFVTCGVCPACNSGDVFHCAAMRSIGMGGAPGGFAEYVTVPMAHAFRLPDGTPKGLGALVEPLAVGLHTARAGGVKAGSKALVIGGGGIGLAPLCGRMRSARTA